MAGIGNITKGTGNITINYSIMSLVIRKGIDELESRYYGIFEGCTNLYRNICELDNETERQLLSLTMEGKDASPEFVKNLGFHPKDELKEIELESDILINPREKIIDV